MTFTFNDFIRYAKKAFKVRAPVALARSLGTSLLTLRAPICSSTRSFRRSRSRINTRRGSSKGSSNSMASKGALGETSSHRRTLRPTISTHSNMVSSSSNLVRILNSKVARYTAVTAHMMVQLP